MFVAQKEIIPRTISKEVERRVGKNDLRLAMLLEMGLHIIALFSKMLTGRYQAKTSFLSPDVYISSNSNQGSTLN